MLCDFERALPVWLCLKWFHIKDKRLCLWRSLKWSEHFTCDLLTFYGSNLFLYYSDQTSWASAMDFFHILLHYDVNHRKNYLISYEQQNSDTSETKNNTRHSFWIAQLFELSEELCLLAALWCNYLQPCELVIKSCGAQIVWLKQCSYTRLPKSYLSLWLMNDQNI